MTSWFTEPFLILPESENMALLARSSCIIQEFEGSIQLSKSIPAILDIKEAMSNLNAHNTCLLNVT